MVRFSEILGTNHKKGRRVDPSKEDIQKGEELVSDFPKEETEDTNGPSDAPQADKADGRVKTYYEGLLERATGIRDRVRKNLDITPSPTLSMLHQIINADLIDALYDYAMSMPQDTELPAHSILVALGSLKLGKGMGYDTKRLLNLGLIALLETVGMYKLPDKILKKEGKLNADEIVAIRKHPEISAEIIGRMGQAYESLARIALQVHERSDGSGYPKGLKGEEISEIASIIGIIDTYMAMTKNKPYRNKYLQTEAIKSILALGKGRFPARVVKEFLNQISLFPVNTYVKLNNGSIGRVISTNKAQPMRPVIELIFDGLGKKLEKGAITRLSDSPLLHIVGTTDEEDLSSKGRL